MTQGYYDIQPFTLTVTSAISHEIGKIQMNINYMVGMTEMYVPFTLTGEYGQPYYGASVVITEAELASWGEDDNYIIDLVCSKVGVTRV